MNSNPLGVIKLNHYRQRCFSRGDIWIREVMFVNQTGRCRLEMKAGDEWLYFHGDMIEVSEMFDALTRGETGSVGVIA